MDRSGKHENRSRKQRPDYAVQNWQDNDYSSRYPDNRYLQSEYNNKYENYDVDHYRDHKNSEQEDDPEDYESYTYEYKKRTYLRSPKSGDDIGKTYSREDKFKTRKQHSAEHQQRNKENFYKEDPTRRLSKYPSDGLHPNDRDVLYHAATKIQSVYRGYQARKYFWKKKEHQRRRESLAKARQPRIDSKTDDYEHASGTSILDGGSSFSLASNIDPNLGITAPLQTLDDLQKLLSTAELYYPKRDQWVLLKPMPEAVMGMACSVLDGCIFVVAGVVNEGNNGRQSISNRVYVSDFEKQTWYRQPQLPKGRAHSSATTVRREIWLWCGVKDVLNEDGLLMSTNTVMVYYPEFSKWELHVTIGTAKHSAELAKFGRRIYLLVGKSNVSGSKEVMSETVYCKRELDKYMEGASLPRSVTGLAAVALPMDYTPSSASKWNVETVDDDALNEAATKIQSVYRGYKCRSILSNERQPMPSDAVRGHSFMNVYSIHTSTEPFADKWKMFQKVQVNVTFLFILLSVLGCIFPTAEAGFISELLKMCGCCCELEKELTLQRIVWNSIWSFLSNEKVFKGIQGITTSLTTVYIVRRLLQSLGFSPNYIQAGSVASYLDRTINRRVFEELRIMSGTELIDKHFAMVMIIGACVALAI